jgi:hypothetical protein
MKKIMMGVSGVSLVSVLIAPVLFYTGRVSLDAMKIILNTATIVWFVSALCWMGREKETV